MEPSKLWVTTPAGVFATRAPGPGEKALAVPLPLLHDSGFSAGSHFGVPTDFQEGRAFLSDPSSDGQLCLLW